MLANFSGFLALVLWASTALILTYCPSFPSLMVTGLSLLAGFAVFLVRWPLEGKNIISQFKVPLKVMLLAIIGIGLYLILFIFGLRNAPVAEANLINYLWPVLIVLFSGLLPNENLRWFHILGALIGFLGIAVLLIDDTTNFLSSISIGHGMALLAAIVWALYSVLSRLTKNFSSDVVAASFLITGSCFVILSLITENHSLINWSELPFVLMFGLATSLGYFFWDIGMKHGNIQVLGTASYSAPLLSTLLLLLFNKAESSPELMIASLLIFLAPMIASHDQIFSGIRKHFKK